MCIYQMQSRLTIGGYKNLTEVTKDFPNSNKFKFANRAMRREVLARKGNSPKYLLRSLKKESINDVSLSMRRTYFLEQILFTEYACVRLSCPGS